MKRLLLLLVSAALVVILFNAAGNVRSQVVADYERVVKIVREGPRESCGGDNCVQALMEPIRARFSTVGSPVTLVATVSFRYRTSPGDPAEIRFLYREAGSGSFGGASPGSIVLDPSPEGTTTSASWRIRGLQADTDYDFTVEALGRASGDFSVATRNLVIILEGTA